MSGKMNPAVRDLFVFALETRTFKQTTGALRSEASGKQCYCVLGVLCELFRLSTGRGEWTRHGNGYTAPIFYQFEVDEFFEDSVLPEPVMKWAGLDEPDPTVVFASPDEEGELEMKMTDANDGHHVSFPQFAYIVKENL